MNVLRRPKLLFKTVFKSDISNLNYVTCYCSSYFIRNQLSGSTNDYTFVSHLRENNLCTSRLYCSNSDSSHTKLAKRKQNIRAYLEHNKEKLLDTEKKLKERGHVLLQDIRETKSKVKEKVEEVVEKENIYTIPNLLCITRMMVSPYLGFLIVQGNFNFALGVLGFAAMTDLLDGWIARTWVSQSSKMGSFLDPMADKILIATLFLTLTYAELIPVALTGLIITRDVLLVAAGFVIRYKSLPPPRTFVRYFDATHATAQLAPTLISKVNTAVQLLLVATTLAAPVFNYIDHPLLQSLWYITGGTTIAAALSYLLSKETYRILKKSTSQKN